MITTLRDFLQQATFIQIPDIKRHAKGLLTALEKSNRKEFLEYEVRPIKTIKEVYDRRILTPNGIKFLCDYCGKRFNTLKERLAHQHICQG